MVTSEDAADGVALHETLLARLQPNGRPDGSEERWFMTPRGHGDANFALPGSGALAPFTPARRALQTRRPHPRIAPAWSGRRSARNGRPERTNQEQTPGWILSKVRTPRQRAHSHLIEGGRQACAAQAGAAFSAKAIVAMMLTLDLGLV